MNEVVDISIIIPVYNSEKYLETAIQSVLNQTKKEFELILVDDGSKDNSGKICDEFSKKDDRVKVIHKKNEGHCKARNDALEIAKGKYIMFLDNDDTIEKNTLKDNYDIANKYNCDIVKFGKREITCIYDEIVKQKEYIYKYTNYTSKGLRKEIISLVYNGVFRNIWDGLYKKEIIKKFNTEFKGIGGEDEYLNYEMIPNIKNMIINDKVYYDHYFRKGISTSSKYKENVFYILRKNCKMFIETCQNNIEKENVEKYNLIQIKNYLKPYIACLNKKECRKKYFEKVEELKKLKLDLKTCNLINMFKLSKLEALIYIIYKRKWYNLLLLLPKFKYNAVIRKFVDNN